MYPYGMADITRVLDEQGTLVGFKAFVGDMNGSIRHELSKDYRGPKAQQTLDSYLRQLGRIAVSYFDVVDRRNQPALA
jgi:hypothetical protein